MQSFHDELLETGVLSVLWSQFLMSSHQSYPGSQAQEYTPMVESISLMFKYMGEGQMEEVPE